MTLDQFITTWNGKQLEVAGTPDARYQCTDLANGYIRDVLKLPIIEWTDAKDFSSKAGDKYTYIKNTPEGYPLKGDIVVWSGAIGNGHGHIAVCISGDANQFVSFDQNWSKPLFCAIETHNYMAVDGWLRPQGEVVVEILVKSKDFEDMRKKCDMLQTFWDAGFQTAKDATSKIAGLEEALEAAKKDYSKLTGEILQKEEELSTWRNHVCKVDGAYSYTKSDIVLDKPLGLAYRVLKYVGKTG
jgi:hypothetical protein